MLHLPTVKDNLSKYIDAGFPILYIYTYEEAKADRYIDSVAGRREVLEWNGSDGFVNFRTKVPLVLGQSLEAALAFLKAGKELNRKLLVIKDAAEQLNPDGQHKSDRVIALLKEIARRIRKGRFDEIFYVALPNDEERRKIFEIHLNKRRKADVNTIDMDELVEATGGYSGADIEGVVSESIESVFVRGSSSLTTSDLLNCIRSTHSLSEIMREPLEKMSKLYEDRKFKKASR